MALDLKAVKESTYHERWGSYPNLASSSVWIIHTASMCFYAKDPEIPKGHIIMLDFHGRVA